MSLDQRDRWLSRLNEPRYNIGIVARRPQLENALGCFIAIARRSQPLIPFEFEGSSADDFVSRVEAHWDAHASREAYLHDEKRRLARATADYISRIPMCRTMDPSSFTRQVVGHEFYQRSSQPLPFEIPFSNTKRTLRPEVIEALWILTLLFHSVGVYSPPPPAPEGDVSYIPFYGLDNDDDRTAAPKRARATDLARSAMYFRRSAGYPEQKQNFNLFSFSRSAISAPCPDSAAPLTKMYYQQGAGVANSSLKAREKTPLESSIMYFVAKLMELRDSTEARQTNAAYEFDVELQAIPGARTTVMSNISILMLFLKNPLKGAERPNTGTLINFWTYGCTPIYVNGVLDQGVFNFEVSFMDALLEMIYDASKKTEVEVWERLAVRLETAVALLLRTPEPPWRPVAPPLSPRANIAVSLPQPTEEDVEDLIVMDDILADADNSSNPTISFAGPQLRAHLPHLADGQSTNATSSTHVHSASVVPPHLLPGSATGNALSRPELPPLHPSNIPPLPVAPYGRRQLELRSHGDALLSPKSSTCGDPLPHSPQRTPSPAAHTATQARSNQQPAAGQTHVSPHSPSPPFHQSSRSSSPSPPPSPQPEPSKPAQPFQSGLKTRHAVASSRRMVGKGKGNEKEKEKEKERGNGKKRKRKRPSKTKGGKGKDRADTLEASRSTEEEGSQGPESEDEDETLVRRRNETSQSMGPGISAWHSNNANSVPPQQATEKSVGTKGNRPRKRQRFNTAPEDNIPPLFAAFPPSPPHIQINSKGTIKTVADMFEPDWDGVQNTNTVDDDDDLPGCDWHSLPRQVMHFEVPTPRLNTTTGLVELRLEKFQYSYRAKVDENGEPLPESDQPDCWPIIEMLRRWKNSQDAIHPRHTVPALTQKQFDTLTPEELDILLQDVFIVRDEDVSESLPTPSLSSLSSPMSPGVIACLPPYPPYSEGVTVPTSSLQCLTGSSPLSEVLVDFSLRYLHNRLGRLNAPAAASIRVASCAIWQLFTQYTELVHKRQAAVATAEPMVTDEDDNALCASQIALRHALQNLALLSAKYVILPQYDAFGSMSFAVVVNPTAVTSGLNLRRHILQFTFGATDSHPNTHGEIWKEVVREMECAGATNEVPIPYSDNVATLEVQLPSPTDVTHRGFAIIHQIEYLFNCWDARIEAACHGLGADREEPSIDIMCRRIGEWVVSSSGPKGFSHFPQETWKDLPEDLSWMRRLYIEQYLSTKLHLEPSMEVEVQDLRNPPAGTTCRRVCLPLHVLAKDLLDGASAPRFNALSMQSAVTHGHNHLVYALSDDNKADVACSTAGMISTVTVGRPVGITQWTIISAPGTYHPPHFDASGYHTLVQVLDGGSKLWAFARRRPAPTPTPHPGSTETEWQWAAFDDCEVTLVALKVHDRAVMPPGTFHAVITVDIPSLGPRSTVMSGSHFLSRYTMVLSLFAAVEHSIWHDLWTNDTHDDRDYTINRMLAWQASSPSDSRPFTGRNLYALLIFGWLHLLLRSLPWKTSSSHEPLTLESFNPEVDLPDMQAERFEGFPAHQFLQDARAYMRQLSIFIIHDMNVEEREEYAEFWKEVRTYYIAEFNARVKYNKDTQNE